MRSSLPLAEPSGQRPFDRGRLSEVTATSTRARLFDQWSATYDRATFQALTYRPIHDAMLGRLRDVDPERILDLGCGTGQFLPRLRSRFAAATIVGADLSPGMLNEAKRRRPSNVGLALADAMQLPLASSSIDVVTCSESFHWYPDQAAAVDELARVLRPGGRLLIASIAMTTEVGSRAVERWTTDRGQPIRALPPKALRRLLEAHGFEVTHQRRIPRLGLIPWPVLTEARRG